jgi:hypothetical protein
MTGGMQWKPATGAEYLTRYWPDPLTGKRIVKSLGRRSPETEAQYREFFDRRRGAQAEEADLEPKAEMAGSFARALRLTRLPAKHAECLRNLHESGKVDEGGVLVSGVAAILLYEAKAASSRRTRRFATTMPWRSCFPGPVGWPGTTAWRSRSLSAGAKATSRRWTPTTSIGACRSTA